MGIHSSRYVSSNLKVLMKDVQNGEVDEDDLDDAVQKAKKTYEERYEDHIKEIKSRAKVLTFHFLIKSTEILSVI